MSTLRVSADAPDESVIGRAADVIRRGGLVAFPTETVYGLGADALDERAVARIFEAKGRPSYNPLITHVPDLSAARRLSRTWPALADRLGEAFWPGPLTLIVPKADTIPDIVTAGLDSVGVRVPAHPVALALLRAADTPLAAPSANRFTEVSPTTAAHVERGLGDRVEMILDGGPTAVGIESTVLDLTGPRPVLLRPGSISLDALEAVAGPIERSGAVEGEAPRRSPGMVDKHYAPRGELVVFPRARREEMRTAVDAAKGRGLVVGGLLLDTAPPGLDQVMMMPSDAAGYARELYAALHRLDGEGCDLIVVDDVPADPEWAGIRDRLQRAARD